MKLPNLFIAPNLYAACSQISIFGLYFQQQLKNNAFMLDLNL